MKWHYVIAFLNFWKKFIIGDDLRVAATIMWTFLLMRAMTVAILPTWWVMPVVVIGLIAWLLRDTHVQHVPKLSSQLFWRLVMPLYGVILVPSVWFRVQNNDLTMLHFFVPTALQVIICGVALIVLLPLFRRHTAIATILAGMLAWWILGPGLFTVGDLSAALIKAPMAAFFVVMFSFLIMSVSVTATRQVEAD